MGAPRGIDPMTYPTMNGHTTTVPIAYFDNSSHCILETLTIYNNDGAFNFKYALEDIASHCGVVSSFFLYQTL